MKLVASLVVRNEAARYLRVCLDSLLGFCDEIRVLDDGSTDGSAEMCEQVGAVVRRSAQTSFFVNEGRTRQELLVHTMAGQPTHIVSVDADEFIADGAAVRCALEEGSRSGVWKLTMSEVWKADKDTLWLRTDGAWSPRPIGILFSVPPDIASNRVYRRHWRLPDKALACGRTPLYVTMMGNRTSTDPVTSVLHFGWTCEADREARHARYVEHDGGAHHASKHLDSIMLSDAQCQFIRTGWPVGLAAQKDALVKRAARS